MFWPGEFHGLYSPLGHQESDTTEQTFTFTLLTCSGTLLSGTLSFNPYRADISNTHFSDVESKAGEGFNNQKNLLLLNGEGNTGNCGICETARW